jgi:hypothetical protein
MSENEINSQPIQEPIYPTEELIEKCEIEMRVKMLVPDANYISANSIARDAKAFRVFIDIPKWHWLFLGLWHYFIRISVKRYLENVLPEDVSVVVEVN